MKQRQSSWRIGLARRVHYLAKPFEFLLKFVRQLQSAIPVGLLRREEIEDLVWDTYNEVPDFYNPEHYRIRYEEQLLPLLEKYLSAGASPQLLDLYCGHGREAGIFAQAGFAVTGVDVQTEVIARARAYAEQAGFEANFVNADIGAWEPDDKNWDVVYTSLWMYSTIPDRSARLAWLTRLACWSAANGVLVLSITPRSHGIGPSSRHAIARVLALLTFNRRRPEPGDRFQSGLFWHDFTADEITQELRLAKLRLLDRLDIGGGTPCNFFIVCAEDSHTASRL